MLSQKIIVDVGINEANNVHYVQGEKGRALEFSFINSLNEDSVVDLTGYDVTIHILKSDGNFTIDSLNIDSQNNKAFYTLTENDCIVGGCGVYDLSLSKNGELIYTANGKYTGDFRAVTDDTVNSISVAYGVPFPEGFQEKLIAGDNITIENNVISASGGGSGTSNYNDLNNKPSINGITLSGNKTSSDLGITDTTYTAGTGLSLSAGAFSLNSATQTALAEIDNKQDRLTAGDNITIENNVISATGGGGTSVIANPSGAATDELEKIQIDNTIYSIESGGATSEIIALTAGDGTTSRTFTFSKLPKLIKIYWTTGNGWSSDFIIVWGQDIASYNCSVGTVPSTNGSLGCASVTFNTTNKSMTLTGANSFGCANDLTGSGYMFVDYGGGAGGTNSAIDISYDNTTSGLVAENVQAAIDENASDINTLNSNIFVKGFSSVPITIPTIGALSTNDVTVSVSCNNPFTAVIVESASITNVYPIGASVISQTSIKIRFRNNDNTTYSNVNTTVNVLFI